MATFQKFEAFVEALANGTHNLGTDQLALMLSNTAPDLTTDAVKADITELATGTDGYTAGGENIAILSSTQTSGIYSLVTDDSSPVFWTSTGTLGPFRYIVLYNKDAASDDLIAMYDRGSSLTLSNGDAFAVVFDQDGGTILTIT